MGMSEEKCGMDALRAEAARVLLENASLFAEMLGKKAIEGDKICLKFLCELAREHMELSKAESKGPKRSLATEWMNEPEWTDEDERAARGEVQ